MSADRMGVVLIDAASREMRRRLGPASWVVFEELLLAASLGGDEWQASVSVRILAERPGLSKDTVARAVAPAASQRPGHPASGALGRSVAAGLYELTIPNGITVGPVATVDRSTHRHLPPRTAAVDVAQLSLPALEP